MPNDPQSARLTTGSHNPADPMAPPRSPIRAVLVIGFGLTLAMWLVAGFAFTLRVSGLQRDSGDIAERYVRAQTRMSAVKDQVLRASVYVRDALLDRSENGQTRAQRRLDESFTAADRALAEHETTLRSADELERTRQLRSRVDEFHDSLLNALLASAGASPEEASTVLQERIVPKREEALRVLQDVQALSRANYDDQRHAIDAVYSTAKSWTWTLLGLALVASLFVGAIAIRQATHLEESLQRQRAKDATQTSDLRRLSAQIITAQEDQRRVIARELHDEVGQALMAIKVELSVADRHHPADYDASALATARSLTDDALHTVRDLSRLLHPAIVDDIGLTPAIESYIRDFRKRFGIAVTFSAVGSELRLSAAIEVAAYRVLQEALTNVVRHASASSCTVTLLQRPSRLVLTVEDDGRGFMASAESALSLGPGLGLLGMRERAARLGGSLCVDSAPLRGTRLTAEFPVPEWLSAPKESLLTTTEVTAHA